MGRERDLADRYLPDGAQAADLEHAGPCLLGDGLAIVPVLREHAGEEVALHVVEPGPGGGDAACRLLPGGADGGDGLEGAREGVAGARGVWRHGVLGVDGD